MRRLGIFFLLIFLMPFAATAATLEVTVIGIAGAKGDVHVALYDNPDAFPDSDGMRIETKVDIVAGKAEVRFADLQPGRYALAVYHDKNGNHDFDQGLFGIPLEDYGFSNSAAVFFGPPSFDDAAIQVSAPVTRTQINLGN